MFRRVSFLLLAALLPLAGCATIDRTVDTSDRAGISRIGVTSALSESMNHDFVGTLVFENQRNEIPVPQWDMRGFAERTLARYLEEKVSGVEAAQIDVGDADRKTFAAAPDKVLRMAEEQGFDTAAIIFPSRYSNFPYVEAGYGIYRRSMLGLSQTCAYQQTVVHIYDVASRKRLAWEWGFNSWDGPCGPTGVQWQMPPALFSEDQMTFLRADIERRFDEGLERAVRKLGFGAPAAP